MRAEKKFFSWKECYNAMMSGISHMIPIVVAGGIIMSVPNFWTGGGAASCEPGTIGEFLYTLGNGHLIGSMYYILAIFTAMAIGGRPAIVGGLICAVVSISTGAGFVGAVLGGFVAGYIAKALTKYLKLPDFMASTKPILFIPIISAVLMGLAMNFVIAPFGSWIMDIVYNFAVWVQEIGMFWLFTAVICACVTFGMGGPVAYGIYPLVLNAMATGQYGITAAGVCGSMSSCFGIALATLVFKKKYTPEDRAGVTGLLTGFACSVTEFEIPYFIKDLKVMTPCLILSGLVGGSLIGLLGVELPAVHGGLFTVALANNVFRYMVCILAQALTTFVFIGVFKKDLPDSESRVISKKKNDKEATEQ